jgi:hypothetical protein
MIPSLFRATLFFYFTFYVMAAPCVSSLPMNSALTMPGRLFDGQLTHSGRRSDVSWKRWNRRHIAVHSAGLPVKL